jgi:hypothetical protein
MSYKRRTGKKLFNAKATTIDGVKMKSRLESSMYSLLKDSGLEFYYEKETFVIVDPFRFENESYERKANNKGEMIDRGNKKIQPIKYTPDFTIDNDDVKYIIETKGFRTETFNMRYKLFKKYITDEGLNYKLYSPHTQKECQEVMRLILESIKQNKPNE